MENEGVLELDAAPKAVRTTQRDCGIDLLRLLSMFMIVCLHVLSQGSVMVRYSSNPLSYDMSWMLESLAMCAVNCYGLISGYVGVNSKWRLSRFLRLYANVWFYSAGITLITGIAGTGRVTGEILTKSLFPISGKAYWYFSCYAALFFMEPFLNKLLLALTDLQRRILFHSIFWIFCAATMIPKIFSIDYLVLLGGYSFVWLAALYLCGGCLALTPPAKRHKRGYYAAMYVLLAMISWLYKLGMERITRALLGEAKYARMLLTYTAPTMFLCGVCLLLACRGLYIRSQRVARAISCLAGSAFSVYLIHAHPMIWEYALKGAFKRYSYLPAQQILGPTLLAALGIFAACLLADQIRRALFRLLHVDIWCSRLEGHLLHLGRKYLGQN